MTNEFCGYSGMEENGKRRKEVKKETRKKG